MSPWHQPVFSPASSIPDSIPWLPSCRVADCRSLCSVLLVAGRSPLIVCSFQWMCPILLTHTPLQALRRSANARCSLLNFCCESRAHATGSAHVTQHLMQRLHFRIGSTAPEDLTHARPPEDLTRARPPEDLTRARPPEDLTRARPPEDLTRARPPEDLTRARPPEDLTRARPPEDLTRARPPEDLTRARPPEDLTHATILNCIIVVDTFTRRLKGLAFLQLTIYIVMA